MPKSERDKVVDRFVSDKEKERLRSGKASLYEKGDIRKRAVKRANSQLYKDYYRAMPLTNKAEIAVRNELQARFGFSSPEYVTGIIKKYDEKPQDLIIEARNKVELFRSIELHKTYESYLQRIAEIDFQLADLVTLREVGDEWYEYEEIDSSGGKYEGSTTKKIKINDRILQLKEKRDKAYGEFYDLLGKIAPTEKHIEITKNLIFSPDQALIDMYKMNDEHEEIEADYEEVK